MQLLSGYLVVKFLYSLMLCRASQLYLWIKIWL